MNTGPYSHEKVQNYLEEEFVPVKSQCFWDKRTDEMNRFNVSWTPTLVVLDSKGGEHHRVVGFVPDEDFLGHLALGKGKIHFDRFRFEEAIKAFSDVIEHFPNAGIIPEAIYFQGVARYWKTHDAKELRKLHDALVEQFPRSEWTRRAGPYGEISL
ncbi:MAG: hypothetical protein ACOWWM_14460 [Desulfobacterales bacterium]